MDNTVIINASLVFPERIRKKMAITYHRGKITGITDMSDLRVDNLDNTDAIIDAKNKFVAPGFIDIHTHGGGGHDFMDGTIEAFLGAAKLHAQHGTTALLPTTLTSTYEELLKTFYTYKEANKRNRNGASFIGLHLEGPYFACNQRGAQDARHIRKPSPEEYSKILEASQDIVRWSAAPELEGALKFGQALKSKNILASVAHTNAIYEEIEAAFTAGYTHITHLYSAMSSVTRRNAFRYAGVVEAAYLIENMTVEIIADGVHLPRPLLQLVYKIKGPDKIALCTDSMRAAGMQNGESILGSKENGQKVLIEDGVAKLMDRSAFAGSTATTDRLVRTMTDMAKVPLHDAVKMMTLTPARIMKIDTHKGSLEIGKDADIVIFDEKINILYTIVEGHVIYKKEQTT